MSRGLEPGAFLAIDTATSEAAVALASAAETTERRLAWRAAFREAAPAAEALLEAAGLEWQDLAGIAIPGGPGSFTGLRVAAALALAIADVHAIPLFAPPTLTAVAEACAERDARRVCVSLDARRGRRYAGVCIRGGPYDWRVDSGPFDVEPQQLPAVAQGAPIVSLETAAPQRPTVAAALAALAAGAPELYRVSAPDRLLLAYVRPAVTTP